VTTDKLFVVDTLNYRIQIFDHDGNFINSFGSYGKNKGELNRPYEISFFNDMLYVLDTLNHRIQTYDLNGNFLFDIGSFGNKNGNFDKPHDVIVSKGKIFVADPKNYKIQMFDQNGNFVISIELNDDESNFRPHSIDVFNNILYAADTLNYHISTFDVPDLQNNHIPNWIRNNAKWWSEGNIGDADFSSGIEYMIKENIIVIPDLPKEETQRMKLKDEKRAMGLERDMNVPDWVRNNAGWWANGLISDDDFVSGIKYLVEQGIILV